jgi:ABC-type branched-subunit amino acid transport system substrate-binding protein
VEVNIVFPETGTFTFPEMGTAVEAAEKAVNDSGGINGRPLKVNICDTTSATDPNPTIACLRSVTANQNIVAELGDYSSFADIATPLENAAHLVQIGAPPLGVSQQELPNAYPLVMPEEEAFGAALVKIGATNPGLLYIDIPTAQKAFSQINAYLKAGGSSVKLTTSEPAPITSTDLSPQAAALCKNDAVAMTVAYTQIAQYLTARAQGSCPQQKVVTAMIGIASTLSSLGSLANGMYVDSGLPFVTDTSVPGVKMFIDQMNAIDPKAAKDSVSEGAWLSVWAFAQEARLLKGPITRDTVWDQWSHLGSFQVFGMLPPGLNLQKGITQIPHSSRLTDHWIQLGTIENGTVQPSGQGWIDVLNLRS